MITVILYGHLAKLYGKRHLLAISTPGEAIRAMCANYPSFRKDILQDGKVAYRVLCGKEDRASEDGMRLPVGAARFIKIVPVIAGAGKGFGQVLLGAALIGASFIPGLQGPLLGGIAGAPVVDFSIATVASSIGFSLALGGISSMLFSPPRQQTGGSSERPNNRPSYNFNGAINTIGQGNCVPICYGRMRVGSQVISAGTETVNL